MIDPLGSRVLIDPRKVQAETSSGIIIPTNKDDIQQIGTVVAVGDGYILDNGKKAPLSVKVGDIVIFAKFAGSRIPDKDKSYLILDERDILAKIAE